MKPIRASLEVGFAETGLPPRFAALRGRNWRAEKTAESLPYEDAQFEVVLLSESVVTRAAVKEAHRVLRADGRLYFSVPARTRKQAGFTLPEIYSIVRDGFHIVEVDRPHWWRFFEKAPRLTICARKKNWKALRNTYRPYL